MVGIFARMSGAHRRTQSAALVVETLAPRTEAGEPTPALNAVPSHGLELKPVEHPVEPLNHDQPVKCPQPEPSILNDGRIWKERMSSVGSRVRTDLPVVKEGIQSDSDTSGPRPKSSVPRRAILPSVSAPEGNIVALLDECDGMGIENANNGD
ncbi:hypothetical protein LUZ60_016956 [Juncus effusus]|nr:hypothetical protein LUZ60_016956 [Juncus effusus]